MGIISPPRVRHHLCLASRLQVPAALHIALGASICCVDGLDSTVMAFTVIDFCYDWFTVLPYWSPISHVRLLCHALLFRFGIFSCGERGAFIHLQTERQPLTAFSLLGIVYKVQLGDLIGVFKYHLDLEATLYILANGMMIFQ